MYNVALHCYIYICAYFRVQRHVLCARRIAYLFNLAGPLSHCPKSPSRVDPNSNVWRQASSALSAKAIGSCCFRKTEGETRRARSPVCGYAVKWSPYASMRQPQPCKPQPRSSSTRTFCNTAGSRGPGHAHGRSTAGRGLRRRDSRTTRVEGRGSVENRQRPCRMWPSLRQQAGSR